MTAAARGGSALEATPVRGGESDTLDSYSEFGKKLVNRVLFRRLIRCGAAVALAATVLFAAPFARCQEAPAGPLHPRPGVPPEQIPPAEQQKHAIRVRVNEVTAPVIVRDPKGEMVFDLRQDNFRVYDNGAEQKIDHFDVGGDPLSIVLVIEASSHIQPMFPSIKHAGIVFSEAVMAQTSEAAVLSYDSTVDLRVKFTTDPDSVQYAIEHLPLGEIGRAHV